MTTASGLWRTLSGLRTIVWLFSRWHVAKCTCGDAGEYSYDGEVAEVDVDEMEFEDSCELPAD